MNRKVMVNGKEVSIRFYYGDRDEKHPERSYTKEINLTHGPNKGTHRCRFVECRVEENVGDGWKPLAVAEAVCGPEDRFMRKQGRAIALSRAVKKMGLDVETQRMVRVYGVGDYNAIKRYEDRNPQVRQNQESVNA